MCYWRHTTADSLSMAISPENIKSSHDVFISLFGELKIHTSHGVLPESDLKSPKISRLLTFMLLSNKKALSSLEIVQEIWPEELEDKDEPGKRSNSSFTGCGRHSVLSRMNS